MTRAAWTRIAKKPAKRVSDRLRASQGAKKGSPGEELLAFQLRAADIPGWEREFRFHQFRRWRLDFAFPTEKIGIEIDGGIWMAGGGRHNRGAGFEADCQKMNALALAGWRVLRYTPAMVKSRRALCDIQIALMDD